jgi:hypothetical protein
MKIVICILMSLNIYASGTVGGSSSSAGKGSSSGSIKNKFFEKKREENRKKRIGSNVKSFDHSHQKWNAILNKNIVVVKKGITKLKYNEVNQGKLVAYTNSLLKVSKKTVDSWSKNQQLAFYFNLYNALTIKLITDQKKEIKSIKDIGSLFKSTWKKKFFVLFGEKSYLDRIEHELVRSNEKLFDHRLHFAFNCASIGCPALPNYAFNAGSLEKQLKKAENDFLADSSRNKIDGNIAYVSEIFKWYKSDFQKSFGSLEKYFMQKYKVKKINVKYLDYDWNLNKI